MSKALTEIQIKRFWELFKAYKFYEKLSGKQSYHKAKLELGYSPPNSMTKAHFNQDRNRTVTYRYEPPCEICGKYHDKEMACYIAWKRRLAR